MAIIAPSHNETKLENEKTDRQLRAQQKEEAIARSEKENEVMESFFKECKPFLTQEDWDVYHDNMWQQGQWTYAFERVIYCLAEDQTPITPNIRKAIDECLEVFEIKRESIKDLSKLKYDAYWQEQYGYK